MEKEFIEFLNTLNLSKEDIKVIIDTDLPKRKIKIANFLLKVNKAGFCTFLIYKNKNNFKQVILKYTLYYLFKNKNKYIKKLGEENYKNQINVCLSYAIETKIKDQEIGLSNFLAARSILDLNIMCSDFFIFQNMYSKNYINFSDNINIKKGDKISNITLYEIHNFSYQKAKEYILKHSKKFKSVKAYAISLPFSYHVFKELNEDNEFRKFFESFSFLSTSKTFPQKFQKYDSDNDYKELFEILSKNNEYKQISDTIIISKKELKFL